MQQRASVLWPVSGPNVKDAGEFPMNTFLVQVGIEGGYSTIVDQGYYENRNWDKKVQKGNKDHVIVEPGDQLVVYCAKRVPNKDHKKRLAFSVDVSIVSKDRLRFEVGKPQLFENPLKFKDISKYVNQGKLDKVFDDCCGKQEFNIIKLEPKAVKQLLDIVKP